MSKVTCNLIEKSKTIQDRKKKIQTDIKILKIKKRKKK